MKFSVKNFFSKCGQIRRKLRIRSHLLKKSLMENFIFCIVMLEIDRFLRLTYSQSCIEMNRVVLEVLYYAKIFYV